MIFKYSNEKLESLLKIFNTNLNVGLSKDQVILLTKKYGLNTLKDNQYSAFNIFIKQIKSPFIYLLILTSILSYFLNDKVNTILIILIILVNIILGFYQEYKAKRTLAILQKKLYINTKVLRDGLWQNINSKELVPGDIIELRPGDYIPADIRFLKSNNLSIDESVLTGESFPVSKNSDFINTSIENIYEAKNLGFLSTNVISGSAVAIVLATGQNTMISGIGNKCLEIEQDSNFQKKINKFSKFTLSLIISTLFIIFFLHLLIKWPKVNIIELALFSIALTLGLTPEALPTVITFSLSRAALMLSRLGLIIKRLSAIEDLGSINILCTDKTGTLTENKLKVSNILSEKEDFGLYAILSIEKNPINQGPFDKAILGYFDKNKNNLDNIIKNYCEIEYIPFDPIIKKNIILYKNNDKYIVIQRGAPEEILKISKANIQNIENWINSESLKGARVLAFAFKIYYKKINLDDIKSDLDFIFLGILSFIDPIKKDAKNAIEQAKKLGIEIKVLTGDSKEVSCTVAKQIGLISDSKCNVIIGKDFNKLSDTDKIIAVKKNNIFVRVLPEDKYKILNLLKKEGNVVGFLGEGVNDAPALKKADVAIVVQGSSDLAKDTADIVLVTKNLKTIIEGIKYGRIISANVKKYIKITLAANFGNFYSIAVASLFINFLPMSTVQILLVNLISDFPMISIVTDNVDLDEISQPSTYNLKEILIVTTIFGIISSFFDFILFGIFYKYGSKILQTAWFIASLLTELILIFSLRSKKFFIKASRPSNILIFLSILSFIFTIILPNTEFGKKYLHFTTLSLDKNIYILFITIFYFIFTEIIKAIFYKIKFKIK